MAKRDAHIMAAIDDLTALEGELDALLALVPTDVATAVAAQAEADAAAIKTAQDNLAQAQTDATTKEAALQVVADALKVKVAALQAALGGAKPPALTVTPTTISETAATPFTAPVAFAGGVAPYTASGEPAGVTFDGANLVGDTTTVAGASTITFSDSSSPALSATLDLTIN